MIKQPSYRFVGFEDEWKEVKVSDIFRVTRGQVLATTQISEEKTDTYKYPVYSSQTKNEGLLGYYDKYLFETAITWTTDGANAGTVNYREGKFYSTNVNGVLLSDEGFANKVIAEILNNEAWKYVSKVGNPKLMNNVMSEISLVIPNDFREISILSTFFQDIDQLISLQQRKLEVLKEQKKTYLKLLFPAKGQTKPALRFAGFENDWKEVKLGEIIQSISSKNYITEYYEEGNNPVIQQGDIPIVGFSDNKPFNNFSNVILFGDHTLSLFKPETPFLLATDGIKILHSDLTTQPFLFIMLERYLPKSQGYKRHYSLLKNELSSLPSLPEQEVIGSFFQDLDKAIAKQEEKVNQLKESKQTLLRKMFI
ncbi:restriction endonuclease subunit S [Streptococcus sp. 2741]|uniref:restriction endonuclease subunit S n=1 Tax=Streptococcus sp. 2741 TaxID=2582691 RepID=UPI0015628904|nr:restriction endonuclease subunit S [Streptococcus sp. 2741]